MGSAKDSILFLIDCSPEMFRARTTAEGAVEVPWVSAIRCASATMQNKIVSSEDDLVGVLLYNTRADRNVANFAGIYLLQGLDVPDAERIRELERLAKDPAKFFASSIGAAGEPAVLGNVFWACSSIFGPLKRKVSSKRVFLFTNEDRPHEGNVPMQRAAKIRARDLADLGIFIELFSLNKAGQQFDLAAFYQDILPLATDEDDGDGAQSTSPSADSSEKFAELMAKVRRKESRKRALARMPFVLGDSVAFSVRLYSLLMETKRGQYVWMDAKSNKLVKPVTEWIASATGATVAKEEMRFYFDFGGEKAVFSRSELAAVKEMGPPGLSIVCFKPRESLKQYHNLTHSTFVFPDETTTRGSIVAFTALLDSLAELDRVAICRYIARKASPPKLVALLPQREELDEAGVQVKPPGFHMVTLPFADDVRHLAFEGMAVQPPTELVAKAKEIIARLTISSGFDPELFENPLIQRHYACLQALALDQDLAEEDLRDAVAPDVARIEKRAGGLLADFTEMIPAAPVHVGKAAGKRAKEHIDDAGGTPQKRERPVIDIGAIGKDPAKLAKATVPELKAFLESVHIRPGKLKAELLEQVSAHFKSLQ
jgi:ATP-dependent DNA helicase 2 subunit 1